METLTQDTTRTAGDIAMATAQIVAAVVNAKTVITPTEVGDLVTDIRSRLLGETALSTERPEPAVSIRASVKPDHIVCLECGEKMKMIKRHLGSAHGLTTDEYRARWGLSADYPMVAPAYAEVRRDLAIKIGLGRKPGQKRGRQKKATA